MNLYLNDLGLVCALGADKQVVLNGLIGADVSGMQESARLLTGRRSICGVVHAPLASIPEELGEFDCRNNQLLSTAMLQIAPGIQRAVDSFGSRRLAVVVGTSTSGIAARESAHEALIQHSVSAGAYHYRQQEIGTAAEFASRLFNLEGPRYTISTACSSSAKAIAAAARLIRAGWCDAALAGGVDTLCGLTLNGFDALESLAPGQCNPFSRNRCGINIGEAACFFLLTSVPGEIRLFGYGESSDGYHMAAPDPDGRGAELAIHSALSRAEIQPADVDYINLHGTATPKNDAMEGAVINRIFGDSVLCSSTKTQTGHTLGAAGALEAGLCWLLLSELNENRWLPKHIWDGERDEAIPDIELTQGDTRWRNGIFLSNTFGFGGSNASLILGRS
jgi:3-oxoacyl-[acyl-carrier-protein] synthase-1